MEENFLVTRNIENKPRNEGFITLNETIARAKKRGVDFGNGNAKNRLRYYAKKGLIPPAKRKVFEGTLPTGAYPEYVVDILVDIDNKLKEGKSILSIAEDTKKQGVAKTPVPRYEEILEEEKEEFIPVFKNKEDFILPPNLPPKRRVFSFAKAIILFFILAIISLSFIFRVESQEFISYFLASIYPKDLLVQAPSEDLTSNFGEETKSFILPQAEPYLTINVETDINAPLNMKGVNPQISFFQDNFKGSLTLPSLSANRNYNLPDSSGTICLTSGNCIGLGGEITSPGGTANRLAKFLTSGRIGNSSILDLYTGGERITINELGNVKISGNFGIGIDNPENNLEVNGSVSFSQTGEDSPFQVETNNKSAIYVDSEGNVGIGEKEPKYSLQVEGGVQASGDICTDLKGGKCLSDLEEGGSMMIIGGGGSSIDGSGSGGYLTKWTDSDTLSSSILYQSGSNIGIGTTGVNEKLTIGGVISLAESSEPSTTTDYGKLYVTTNNKLYFKDEAGSLYDLTAPGVAGSGSLGEISFFTATTTIAGDSNFFWDNTSKYLGIGTSSPDSVLHIVGTSTLAGDLIPGSNNLYGLGSASSTWKNIYVSNIYVASSTIFNGISYVWPSTAGTSSYALTTNGTGTLSWSKVETTDNDWFINGSYMYAATSTDYVGIGTTSPGSRLEVRGLTSDNTGSGLNITDSNGVSLLYVRNDGNVGIGTTSPNTNLYVIGTSTLGVVSSGIWQGSPIDISDYTNLVATGTLLTLSGDTLSINEGTLNHGELCQYSTSTGLICAQAIGTELQAYDAGLASIAGLTTATNQMLYTTGSDTYSTTSLTAYARTILDDADASTARTTLELGTMALLANTGSTTITTLGTISTGTWEATAIASQYGGTGKDFSTSTGILQLTKGTFATTTFTAGSILFASSTGLITEDNTNFFWDNTNNRLGIGTTHLMCLED